MRLAQLMVDRIVASTVKWANSGFEGNPAYVVDPKQYFGDIADGAAIDFLRDSQNTLGVSTSTAQKIGKGLDLLCSPFKANIRLSLIQQYYEPEPFQCTLTEIAGNIENFYNDFSQGGWDAWFSMTQVPTNNPYGAYLEAKIELDSQIATALGLEKEQLDWNIGFRSWAKCLKKNPPATISTLGLPEEDPFGRTEIPNPDHVPGKAEGECIQRDTVSTPGSVIKSGLDKVLPAGLEKLIKVEHVEQLVEAFAVGVLKRYVFGDKGLFDTKSASGWAAEGGTTPPGTLPGRSFVQVDIDGDGIYDGIDTDQDGDPDQCYFGGSEDPTGPPCAGSASTVKIPGSSPGGGGGQCSVTGYQYEGALRDAMSAVLAENPAVGDLPNIESGGRQNARTFLALVETKLKSMGYEATDEVLNGNGNPSTGDIIAVWRSGDTMMERYDAIIGAAPTIRAAVTADFTGFIPLNCTSSGGGKDCGCKSNTGAPSPTSPNPTTPVPTTPTGVNPPLISSVSPTSVTAGQTTLTITGTDLTATVQFFDGAGNRNTVLGSVNSTKTQVTVLVPGDLPSGNATVKIYKDASTVSNGKLIQVAGAAGPAAKAVEAELNLGPGTFPDVAFFDGRIYLAVQMNGKLLLYNWKTDLTEQNVQEIPYQGDQAFPKLTVYNNVLWLAFRENYSSTANAVKLWRSDTQVIENLGGGFGNDPVALQNGFVAWQLQQADGTWKIVRRALTGGSTTIVKNAVGTGLSRILANGTVVTIDEDRFAVTGYTRPWVAGGLTVTEGKNTGLFGFWNNPSTPFSITSSQFSLFPGQTVFAPHAATDGTLYAVTTWGPSGARIAVIKK